MQTIAAPPRRQPPPLPLAHPTTIPDTELFDDDFGPTTRTAPPGQPSSKRAALGVFAGAVVFATALTASLLLWLPSDPTPPRSVAARPEAKTGTRAPTTPNLADLAAAKIEAPPASLAAKADPKPGKARVKAGKKAPKTATKRASPAPKRRPAA